MAYDSVQPPCSHTPRVKTLVLQVPVVISDSECAEFRGQTKKNKTPELEKNKFKKKEVTRNKTSFWKRK